MEGENDDWVDRSSLHKRARHCTNYYYSTARTSGSPLPLVNYLHLTNASPVIVQLSTLDHPPGAAVLTLSVLSCDSPLRTSSLPNGRPCADVLMAPWILQKYPGQSHEAHPVSCNELVCVKPRATLRRLNKARTFYRSSLHQ